MDLHSGPVLLTARPCSLQQGHGALYGICLHGTSHETLHWAPHGATWNGALHGTIYGAVYGALHGALHARPDVSLYFPLMWLESWSPAHRWCSMLVFWPLCCLGQGSFRTYFNDKIFQWSIFFPPPLPPPSPLPSFLPPSLPLSLPSFP